MMHDLLIDAPQRYRRWALPAGYDHVELDLGCGKGAFLLALAERYPDRLILGADVLKGRLNRIEKKIQRRGLANAHTLIATGWDLIGTQLPDRSLDRVHVLCPDPWPKTRHHARRLLGSEFLGRLATKIKPGGVLHVSTDHDDYFDFIHRAIGSLPWYRPDLDGIADVADIKTDFELLWESQGLRVQHAAFRVVPGLTPSAP